MNTRNIHINAYRHSPTLRASPHIPTDGNGTAVVVSAQRPGTESGALPRLEPLCHVDAIRTLIERQCQEGWAMGNDPSTITSAAAAVVCPAVSPPSHPTNSIPPRPAPRLTESTADHSFTGSKLGRGYSV